MKVDPTKTILFNPKESIDFNGNTGPFIQYTYARICSIVSKAKEENIDIHNTIIDNNITINDKEKEVIKNISSFGNVIKEAGKNYSPSLIANFVYNLAKSFNTFYQDCSILKEENKQIKQMRVCLAYFTSVVIKTSMNLLGIDVPKKM